MSNIDWSKVITKEMKEAVLAEQEYAINSIRENEWRTAELLLAADQLLAIEDDDPTAMPGTERDWRDYRIKVRAWKEGNVDFPNSDKRPVHPAEG